MEWEYQAVYTEGSLFGCLVCRLVFLPTQPWRRSHCGSSRNPCGMGPWQRWGWRRGDVAVNGSLQNLHNPCWLNNILGLPQLSPTPKEPASWELMHELAKQTPKTEDLRNTKQLKPQGFAHSRNSGKVLSQVDLWRPLLSLCFGHLIFWFCVFGCNWFCGIIFKSV